MVSSRDELMAYLMLIVNAEFGWWAASRPDLWRSLGFSPTFEGLVILQWWCLFLGLIAWTALAVRAGNLTIPVVVLALIVVAAKFLLE